ncbi:oxidoreductase [Kitasatospora sp. HPMI-4]|uniref:oxidoreductase n=1 Tax=Kitasatospora sp. HPMI-4 TaxID=3448443 RepID=UPI003F1A631A
MTVWFITGASRGLGLEIARAALAAGDRVVATARDADSARRALPADQDGLLVLPLDVTDQAAAEAAAARALERFGRIDVLVNNAGYGVAGAVEETSDEEARSLFDTNVFGLLNVTRAVLPTLRAQRRGHLVNIGSVGGFSQGAGSGIYGASKFAVEGITEALHAELSGLGIAVTVVEPGQFRTDFLDPASLRQAARTIDDYAGTAGARRTQFADVSGHQLGDPAKAGRAVVALTRAQHPPLRLPLGQDSLERIEAKLAQVAQEIAAWRELASSTGHGPAPTAPALTAPALTESAQTGPARTTEGGRA